MTLRDRMIRAVIRLTFAPGRMGWAARRLLAWTEPRDVRALYEMLLERTPDEHEVVGKLGRHWRTVVEEIVSSDERDLIQERVFAERLIERIASFNVSVEASREDLEMLFRRTQEYWSDVGSDEQTIYWSVLTADALRDAPTREQILSFYDSGREVAEYLSRAVEIARPGISLSSARVLDFGCGVGRVLRHFVGRTAQCGGWDFSRPHLDVLEANFLKLFDLDRTAFETRQLDSVDLPDIEEGFDIVYSVIALQHNPPPLMAYYLRQLLRTLAPGGVALIHLPTAPTLPGYSFSIEDYRSEGPRDMEMHAIPRQAVLRIADEEGVHIPWTAYIHWCGSEVLSELIVFTKE